MSKRELFAQKLGKFLPEKGLNQVVDLIFEHQVKFKITRSRKSKFGDYRFNPADKSEQISVNGDLNPFAFYFTTIHEFAHLIAFKTYGRNIAPHGEEWKHTFSTLLLKGEVMFWFPLEIRPRLKNYIANPKASTASDQELYLALRNYDAAPLHESNKVYLRQLSRGKSFVLDERKFVLIEKRRTRYLCQELTTKREFLVSGLAEVEEIKS
jgi:SprT protein